MSDLVAFLRARLDEDEAVAKAATPGPWEVNDPRYAERIDAADGTAVVAGARWGDEAAIFDKDEDALHIARHDPARVLREVEAKRRIVDVHCPRTYTNFSGQEVGREGQACPTCHVEHEPQEHPCPTLRLLTLPYSDHPDYDPEWRP